MKTLSKKDKRRSESYLISDVIGAKGSGFFENYAYEIRDLVPYDGSFRLRNGTLEGFTLDKDVDFCGSVNCNGNITGYVASGRNIYLAEGTKSTGSPGESRYYAAEPFTQDNTILFTINGTVFMITGDEICRRAETEFEKTGTYRKPYDLGYYHGEKIPKEITDLATNRMSGEMFLTFKAGTLLSSVQFEDCPNTVIDATISGEGAPDPYIEDDTIHFSTDACEGEVICIHASYYSAKASNLKLIGATEEYNGCTYIYSSNAMYRVYSDGTCLFAEKPCVYLPDGGIKKVFLCSGTPILAIGSGLCAYDAETGCLRTIDSPGASSKHSVYSCGSTAYIASDAGMTKLTVTSEGGKEKLGVVSMKDTSDHKRTGKILCMVYSRPDGCLWTLTEVNGKKRILVLETNSSIWFEITRFDSPTSLFECADAIGIVCGSTVYYSSPRLGMDTTELSSEPICGTIVLNPQDMGEILRRKRLVRCAVKASSCTTRLEITLTADSGRSDIYSQNYVYADNACAVFRANIGRFRYLTAALKIIGYDHAALNEFVLEIS